MFYRQSRFHELLSIRQLGLLSLCELAKSILKLAEGIESLRRALKPGGQVREGTHKEPHQAAEKRKYDYQNCIGR